MSKMMNYSVLTAAVVLTVVVAGCGGGGSAPQVPGVTAQVLDRQSLLPVVSATATMNAQSASAGSDGRVTLVGMTAGAAELTLAAPGYSTRSVPVNVGQGLVDLGCELLTPQNPTGTANIAGVILMSNGNTPVGGATV